MPYIPLHTVDATEVRVRVARRFGLGHRYHLPPPTPIVPAVPAFYFVTHFRTRVWSVRRGNPGAVRTGNRRHRCPRVLILGSYRHLVGVVQYNDELMNV